MTYPTFALPDPETQPEFYSDVTSKRFFAWVLDMVFIGFLSGVAVLLTAFTGLFFFPLLLLVVGFGYRVLTLASGSATWGMRFVAIEFRDETGAPFDMTKAVMHTLGYSISLSLFPLQLISIVLMLTTQRKQGLTDHLMGSVAINRTARY
jgi:hypothetical protein